MRRWDGWRCGRASCSVAPSRVTSDFEGRTGIRNHHELILRRATMRGFLVFDHMDLVPSAITDLATWAAEGKLKNEVDVVEGLENAPAAFMRLFSGENLGKQLVKIA